MSRILIAGIGNVFLGDDAFGVEVVARLSTRSLPSEIEVADFGTRGFDLAMALGEPWSAAIVIDAVPRGESPGTLYLLDLSEVGPVAPEAPQGHGLDPVRVLGLLAQFAIEPPPLYLVGCEPQAILEQEDGPGMSPAVQAALDGAVAMVESLAARLLQGVPVS